MTLLTDDLGLRVKGYIYPVNVSRSAWDRWDAAPSHDARTCTIYANLVVAQHHLNLDNTKLLDWTTYEPLRVCQNDPTYTKDFKQDMRFKRSHSWYRPPSSNEVWPSKITRKCPSNSVEVKQHELWQLTTWLCPPIPQAVCINQKQNSELSEYTMSINTTHSHIPDNWDIHGLHECTETSSELQMHQQISPTYSLTICYMSTANVTTDAQF
jgi:hypothetical protein